MKKSLVIVESPAKARTDSRFLGKEFDVRASVGHVRDLLRSQLSVDVDNDFQPKYRVPNEKRPIVRELKNLSARAGEVFLATDPDREGEAIAWHLMESAEIDGFKRSNLGVVSHQPVLATYYENFSLTGLSVTENFGASVGVLKGTDPDELVAANLLLAYQFLRNSSYDLGDVPTLLADHKLTGISTSIQSCSHQDAALQASTNTMIPAAVD